MSIIGLGLLLVDILVYTGQTFGNKMFSVWYKGPEQAAVPVFSTIYGLSVTLITFVYNGCSYSPMTSTVMFGILNGVFLFLFNLASIRAALRGPYSFQSMVMLFGAVLVPMAFCILFWEDHLTVMQGIGVAVSLAALFLFNMKGLNFSGLKKGYFFWVAVLFVTNGAYCVIMDAHQRVAMQAQRSELMMTIFFTTAVISAIYLLLCERGRLKADFHMGVKPLKFLVLSSCCASIAGSMLLYILGIVPATIVYAGLNGGILTCSAILSALVLGEKITWNMKAGIAAAVISMALMSI